MGKDSKSQRKVHKTGISWHTAMITRLHSKISLPCRQNSLPPRYAFGYWWSRWWAYSEHEFKQLIKDFEDYRIPLEVLVIDMDWHYTDEAHGGWIPDGRGTNGFFQTIVNS